MQSPSLNPPAFKPAAFKAEVSKAAAEWLTLTMSGEFSELDAENLHHWRLADPEHERAWQHLQSMSARLQLINGKQAYQTLAPLHTTSRRATLKALAWLALLSGGGLLASRSEPGQLALADYSTATGESREVLLADGSLVTLNTRTALNVDLNQSLRLLSLQQGEILVSTGHQAGEQRPFYIATALGTIQALGTRFNVRASQDSIHISVLEGRVEIKPRYGQARILQSGQASSFTDNMVQAPTALDTHVLAWSKGQLFADDIALEELVQELARYRSGFIQCDPSVAQLRISGVFSLHDTTDILNALPNSLPVSIHYRTRYWVSINALSSDN